ncbi:MAG: DMT family transporter [Spirochaetes bacterium]|nr:DMT family transporter [Spirochaetota bacterium]
MKYTAEIAAIITAASWTVGITLFEEASKRAGVVVVNFVKVVFALVMLTLFVLVTHRYIIAPVPNDALAWMALSGLVGFVIGDLFLFKALTMIGARITMLVYALTPALAAFGAFIFLHETLAPVAIAGVALTLSGIALVILRRKNGESHADMKHRMTGALFAFIAAVSQACGYLFSKQGMRSIEPLTATQLRLATAVVGFAAVLIVTRKAGAMLRTLREKPMLLRLTAASFFGPSFGVAMSMVALKNGHAGVVSTIMAMTPVLLLIPAVTIFKEKIGLREIAGAVLAVAGVALFFIKL